MSKMKSPKLDSLAGSADIADLRKISELTKRKELFWLKGKRHELDVYRIPIKYLYFNIENGRYADKMIQLRADNPGVAIDPRQPKWRNEIWRMLKGDYPGTASDKEPFMKLRDDMKGKQQLKPGVVLDDGGVLDGNRRLAVLLDLSSTEPNPPRFEFFDGVILDKNVDEKDRWRIEAGLQIGRDEKLAYSPINQLLKIKQGVELFRGNPNPAREIAKVLFGVPEKEVKKDVQKISLIDEYLKVIGKPGGYNAVSGLVERFEEVVNIIESAKKLQWSPTKLQQLKLRLWPVLRFETMDNWQMRDIWRAMGASGKGKSARFRNDKAINQFLEPEHKPEKIIQVLSGGAEDLVVIQAEKRKAEAFLDRMEAFKVTTEPLRLAQRAKDNLEELHVALSEGVHKHNKELVQEYKALPGVLSEVSKLAAQCQNKLKSKQSPR
jgi:hypothetical protein